MCEMETKTSPENLEHNRMRCVLRNLSVHGPLTNAQLLEDCSAQFPSLQDLSFCLTELKKNRYVKKIQPRPATWEITDAGRELVDHI